jgi:hypothetical protein
MAILDTIDPSHLTHATFGSEFPCLRGRIFVVVIDPSALEVSHTIFLPWVELDQTQILNPHPHLRGFLRW